MAGSRQKNVMPMNLARPCPGRLSGSWHRGKRNPVGCQVTRMLHGFSCIPSSRYLRPTGGIPNDRSTILSVADFAGFDARGRRGCLCDGRATLRADAPGRRAQQHQPRAVNHSGLVSRSSLPSTINEKTIADFTRVVEQTGILEREPPTNKARQ